MYTTRRFGVSLKAAELKFQTANLPANNGSFGALFWRDLGFFTNLFTLKEFYMKPRERVLAALNLQQPDRVPFVDFIDPGMQKALVGKDDFDQEEMARAVNMDAIFFDDYVISPFTAPRDKSSGREHDEVSGYNTDYMGVGIIRTEDDLKKMILPNPKDEAYYDKAKRFIDKYGDSDLALYAALRPFGLFNTMFSMPLEDFSKALYKKRPMLEKMMNLYVELSVIVLEKLQRLGRIDFIMCWNDMAFKSGPMISPSIFREFFLPLMRPVADAIKLPWAFHSDGDLHLVMDDLLSLGMNAINPFEKPMMSLKEAKAKWGDRLCLWGNVDLHYTLTMGTPEEVEEEVKECLRDAAEGGGYIIASGNSLTDYCKLENVRAMIKAVEKYGKYPIQL